jgi:4-hydroxybenzoate polyprenyltransferase
MSEHVEETDEAAQHEAASASVQAAGSPPAMALALLKAMRPKQWVKNLFVLAPLFFSKSFLLADKAALGALAFGLFCLTAGTVYLINDLFDVEKDRAHPVKRKRPIASGLLPVKVAWIAAAVIGLGSQIAAWSVDLRFGGVLTGYLVMNLAYSTVLKHVVFVDVLVIAVGFVLRVLAGAFAIDVFISEWLIGCTFLLSLYLGLGKRSHELKLVRLGKADKVRKVLERYRADQLDFAVLFVAGLTIACYTIYTLTAALPDQPLRSQHTPFASPYLPMTIPLAVYGITRFYMLLQKDSMESPTELILSDLPFILNIVVWGLSMVVLAFT